MMTDSTLTLALRRIQEFRAEVDKRFGKKGGNLNLMWQACLGQIEHELRYQADMVRTLRHTLELRAVLAGTWTAVECQAALDLIAAGRRGAARASHPDAGGDGGTMARFNDAADRLEAFVRTKQKGGA
jgi:hypothetical protein